MFLAIIIYSISAAGQKDKITGNLFIINGDVIYERIDTFNQTIEQIIPIIQNSLAAKGWQNLIFTEHSMTGNIETSNDYKKYGFKSMKSCVQFGTKTKCSILIQIKEGRYKIIVSSLSFLNTSIGWTSANALLTKKGKLKDAKCIIYGFEHINALLNDKTSLVTQVEDW